MSERSKSKKEVSRRDFLKGASAAAAGVAVAGLTGSVVAAEAGPVSDAKPSWMPEKWDYETEILVVGHGAGGTGSVLCATIEELGEVMVIDAGPEGEDGGTFSVCGQTLFTPTSVEGAVKYQRAMNGIHVVPDEYLQGWAEEMVKNKDWVIDTLGIDELEPQVGGAEFPLLEGADSPSNHSIGALGNQKLWLRMKEVEDKYADKYTRLCDMRARRFVFHPETKEIYGLMAETDRGTKEVYIKAKKGIVMCLGGFTYNKEMMANYFDPGMLPYGLGTPYARGDGHVMCQEIGAAFWHMNNVASVRYSVACLGPDRPLSYGTLGGRSYIFVGPDARRFEIEEWHNSSKHGKILRGGAWTTLHTYNGGAAIFDQETFDRPNAIITADNYRSWSGTHMSAELPHSNDEALTMGIIVKDDTLEGLAAKLDLDPEILKDTVEHYNEMVANGEDTEFHRGRAIPDGLGAFELTPIAGPPWYGMKMTPSIINTQGGPVRNGKAQIMDTYGNPIPRLYSAGEFGCMYSYLYNGGGNIGDGFAMGRIAVRNIAALEPWE